MAANSVLLNTYADPGMGTPQLTQEANPLWGDIRHYFFPVVKLASTTVDARSANTSDLLPGLVLGRITASGLYTHCLAGSSDGSQVPLAVLTQGLSILDANLGTPQVKHAKTIIGGPIIASRLGWIDSSPFRVALRVKFYLSDEY